MYEFWSTFQAELSEIGKNGDEIASFGIKMSFRMVDPSEFTYVYQVFTIPVNVLSLESQLLCNML